MYSEILNDKTDFIKMLRNITGVKRAFETKRKLTKYNKNNNNNKKTTHTLNEIKINYSENKKNRVWL